MTLIGYRPGSSVRALELTFWTYDEARLTADYYATKGGYDRLYVVDCVNRIVYRPIA